MPRGMKRTATNRSRAYLFKQRATVEGAKRRASVCESLSSMRGAQSNIHNVREFLLYSFERIEKKVVINHLIDDNFFVLPSSAEASADLCFLVHLGSFWLTFFFLLPYNE